MASAKELLLSHSELLETLSYDKESGAFIRRFSSGGMLAGSLCSHLNNKGYIIIKIKNKLYMAHRLAWFYVTGEWPKDQIDHKDTDKTNNRFANLREASNTQNKHNTPVYKNNKLKIKGVQLDKYSMKYRARITINKKRVLIGYFETKEAAQLAFNERALRVQKEFRHNSLKE